MGKNLLQLRQSLRSWLAIDDTDELPDEVLNDLINWSINDYLRRRESEFGEASTPFSTVLYASRYTPPAGFSRPRKLWYLDSAGDVVVISWLNKDEFDVRYPHSYILSIENAGLLILSGGGDLLLEGGGSLTLTGSEAPPEAFGDPEHFTMWQKKLILGRAPDREFQIFLDYYQLLPALALDADSNVFTEDADHYIIFNALANASLFGIEDERAGIWKAEAARLENSLDIEDSRRQIVPRRSQSREPG